MYVVISDAPTLYNKQNFFNQQIIAKMKWTDAEQISARKIVYLHKISCLV